MTRASLMSGGAAGCVTRMNGDNASNATGAKSFCASYGRLEYITCEITKGVGASSNA